MAHLRVTEDDGSEWVDAESFDEAHDLIRDLGDAITDMFDQMIRGHWVDDQGHDVRLNQQMIALKPLIIKAIRLRAAHGKAGIG